MSTSRPGEAPVGASSAVGVLAAPRSDPVRGAATPDRIAAAAARAARRCRHCLVPSPSGGTGHTHDGGSAATRGYEATLADLFDLEGRALGGLLDEIVALAGALGPDDSRTVVDLGAGTGNGAVRLAAAFPAARVVALDRSGVMLDRLTTRARREGVGGRVTTRIADLDAGWPQGPPADVVWASSCLGDLAEPDQLLATLRDHLRPGGLLVVVEAVAPPRFLPADGLEDRVAAALHAAGWSGTPDWTRSIEAAGLTVVERRSFTLSADSADHADDDAAPRPRDRRRSGLVGRYARAWFTRVRNRVGDALSTHDLTAVDRLLAAHGPNSLLHRTDLVLRASRVVWAARGT